MKARSTEQCPICNAHLTVTGQCPECNKVEDLKEQKDPASSPAKKDDKQTRENLPSIEGKVLSLRKQKKAAHPAFLFNQVTAERYVIFEALTRIGRDRSNNIALSDDPYISRHHAWILQTQGTYWIEDLGSTNTTLLNGEPVTQRSQISAGDRLTFGKTELKFFAEK